MNHSLALNLVILRMTPLQTITTSKFSYLSKTFIQMRVSQYWYVKLDRFSEMSRILTTEKLA